MSLKEKPHIAWISPIAGAQTSKYVSDTLLAHMSDDFHIDVIDQDSQVESSKYDLVFRQLEDVPGVGVETKEDHTLPTVTLVHDVLFRPGAKQEVIPEFGVNVRPLFSSERNLAEYQNRFGLNCASLLPYPVKQEVSENVAKDLSSPVIIFGGSPQVEHRAHYLLEALSQLSQPVMLRWLIEEGEYKEAERICAEFDFQNVEFIQGRSLPLWEKHVADASLAIHTLFSVYGDPGPSLAISLMAGLPCIVNDFSSASFFPDSVVYKVPSGIDEAEHISRTISAILSSSEEPKLAKEYAIEQHSATAVAQQLAMVFHEKIVNT